MVISGKIKTNANQKKTELKNHARHEEKEHQNDVGDRGVKVASHFSREEGVEFTH
jgi:urease beta subunit